MERLLGRAITDRYVHFCRFASGAFELRVPRPTAAHALRELEGVLRRSLKASLEIRPTEEPIDPLHAKARKELSKLGLESAAIERAVEALKPRTNQANQIRQTTASLGLAPEGDVAEAWISLSKTAGKAHEHSFDESLLVDEEYRQAFQQPCDMVVRAVALHFAFLDPFNLAALPFEVIRKLATLKRMDILIHVSVQDINRNLRRYVKKASSPLDSFAPGWRDHADVQRPDKYFRARILEHWRGLVKSTGMDTTEAAELVERVNQPAPLLAYLRGAASTDAGLLGEDSRL